MTNSVVTGPLSMDQVLGEIATIVGTLSGWTIDLAPTTTVSTSPADTKGGREFICHKNACLVGLRSNNTSNGLYMLDGVGTYSSGGLLGIPGGSGAKVFYNYDSVQNGGADLASGGYNYGLRGLSASGASSTMPKMWMFSDSGNNYVHVVVKYDAVNYRHLHFGNIIQLGTWTDTSKGGYYAGSWWDYTGSGGGAWYSPISNPGVNSHSMPWDNHTNTSFGYESLDWTVSYSNGRAGDSSAHWLSPSPSLNTIGPTLPPYYAPSGVPRRLGSGSGRGGFNRMFKNIQISTFTGLVPMGPILISSINDTATPSLIEIVGEIPDVQMINMTNFSPEDTFAIGSDTWQVFPMSAKGTLGVTAGTVSSGPCAYAYKVVP